MALMAMSSGTGAAVLTEIEGMIRHNVPEATSIITGSLGVPFKPAMLAALLSSAGVAVCYGAAAVVGLSNGDFWLAFAISGVLAALLWFLSRTWRGRMGV